MKHKMYKRQYGLVRPDELEKPIVVIGAGGVGSMAVLALAKMGCQNISVVDFDKVEEHNQPSQLYGKKHVGMAKVDALYEIILELADKEIFAYNMNFEDYVSISGEEGADLSNTIVIVAVDSLDARRSIFASIMKKAHKVPDFYIDARMAEELIVILTLPLNDREKIEKYVASLNPKRRPYIAPCTSRAIVYNTLCIGSFLASIIKKYAKNETIKPEYTIDLSSYNIY